jgi:hypothetical protein
VAGAPPAGLPGDPAALVAAEPPPGEQQAAPAQIQQGQAANPPLANPTRLLCSGFVAASREQQRGEPDGPPSPLVAARPPRRRRPLRGGRARGVEGDNEAGGRPEWAARVDMSYGGQMFE